MFQKYTSIQWNHYTKKIVHQILQNYYTSREYERLGNKVLHNFHNFQQIMQNGLGNMSPPKLKSGNQVGSPCYPRSADTGKTWQRTQNLQTNPKLASPVHGKNLFMKNYRIIWKLRIWENFGRFYRTLH